MKPHKQMHDCGLILICLFFFFFFFFFFLTVILAILYISLQTSTEATVMGIIRGCFTFIAGTVFGIYLSQSYKVPDVKKEADTALIQAKQVEEKYRKSK